MNLYTTLVIITIALLTVTAVDVSTNRVINKKMKKHSIIVCVLIAAAALCEWIGVKTNGAALSLIFVHKLAKLTEFCIAPIISITAVLSYSKIKRPRLAAALMALHIIFEAFALHFGLVINVDQNNIYHRGSLYPVYIVAFSVSIIYYFVCVVRDEIRDYLKPSPLLMATLAFLILGIGIQIVDSDLRVDYLCVAVGNYFVYNHRCKTILQMDGLTRLLNRRCYEKDIEKLSPPAVIINMDVNDFKSINDTFGHSTGDYYLKAITALIRSTYGKYGCCYRCGGDEFCVVLTKNIDHTKELNQKLTELVRSKRRDDPTFPDISIGYAFYNEDTGHICNALEEADEMMYNIKHRLKENTENSND